MKTNRGMLRYLVIGQLLFCFEGAALAQGVDPTKALIGTWEGWAGRNLARTLVIKTVSRNEDGSWIAQGNYGIIGQKLGRRTMNVSIQGGDVELNFFTVQKYQVDLKLAGDHKLVGKMSGFAGRTTSGSTMGFELEKVQPK